MAKNFKEKELDMEAIANQKIIDVELNSEMKKAYIDYAMSVIVARALPDVRDGMKPVHRRILYDMYESGLLYEADFGNQHQPSAMCSVSITLTAMRLFMMQWSEWDRIFRSGIRLYNQKVTLVQ